MSTNVRSSIADSVFLGHEAHVRDFTRLAAENLLGHAYCFFGDEGVGKFRFARAFAHFLERGQWNTNDAAILSDVLVIECGAEETSVGVDVVRAVRKFLAETPFHSPRRTVIVRDAELLTWEAESAFLKIMEEPPSHALILMTVRTPESLFPPLVSRMAKVHFARLARKTLTETLVHEFKVPLREASAVSSRSFGRVGYALRLVAEKKKASKKSDKTLAQELESLILARWEKGVKGEARALAFLLARFEAASRFNLNPRLQSKAISYMISG